MKPLVIAVTGGRDVDPGGPGREARAMAAQFRAFWRVACGWSRTGEVILSVGDARGVDAWVAAEVQRIGEVRVEIHQAQWDLLGKAAGMVRNRRVLLGEDTIEKPRPADLLIAFPGGKGTANCKEQARNLGIEVWEIDLHLFPWRRGAPPAGGVYWTWDGHWKRRREWVPGRGWRLRPGYPEWEREMRCWAEVEAA